MFGFKKRRQEKLRKLCDENTEMRKLLKDMVSHYEDRWDEDGYHTRMRELCQLAREHLNVIKELEPRRMKR